ncbi:hypothetical protein DL768_009427 [Monosporascus sp. mg162]|nr:hypothetical protein DL768_009427 [Monosporascus sp. mg162]
MASFEERNILVVVAVGRRTHITPLLEVCRALHELGHRVSFAGMEGQLNNLPGFVAETFTVCDPMDPTKDAAIHQRIGEAVASTRQGRKDLASALMFFDSFYPDMHQRLKPIVARDDKKPAFDFILADFFDIAAVDLALEFDIPYATCTPQLSFPQGQASFIPGLAGLQQNILTTEHATLGQRVYESWVAFAFVIDMLPWIRSRIAMRKRLNEAGPLDRAHLHFTNSFWGFDTPRAHSPLLCQIGPLVSQTWDPLTPELSEFLEKRSSVAYVSFGTLATLPPSRATKLWLTLKALLKEGHLDGVIWSLKRIPAPEKGEEQIKSNGNILILPWVPQRAVLAHPAIRLFLTHAGTGSTNEALYHGNAMLCMPIHGDQNACALRTEANGIGLRIDKHTFTVGEAVHKAKILLQDVDGAVNADVLRMQRIAVTRATSGPREAASKIQEVMYDHELRRSHPKGKHWRPPHLELPSERMGFWKRNNIDLYTIGPFIAVLQGLASLFHIRY